MTLLKTTLELTLVDLSRNKDVGPISVHAVVGPVSEVEIAGIEEVKTFAFLTTLYQFSQVDRPVLICFSLPATLNVYIAQNLNDLFLVEVIWDILLQPEIFEQFDVAFRLLRGFYEHCL